jgi:hypothetical protein
MVSYPVAHSDTIGCRLGMALTGNMTDTSAVPGLLPHPVVISPLRTEEVAYDTSRNCQTVGVSLAAPGVYFDESP